MHTPRRPSLGLRDYYVVEGLNSFACTLFLLSVFFWTKDQLGFTASQNLWLGVAQGLVYIGSARVCGKLSDVIGYDRMMVAGISGMGVTTLTGWQLPGPWGPFVMVAGFMLFMGMVWPALEAVVMHLPGPMSMPRRLGIYNMVWSLTGALGFFSSGVLFRWNPDAVIWGAGAVFGLEILWFAVRRGRNETGDQTPPAPHRGEHHPREVKRGFLHASWVANSLAYYLQGAFSTLAPFLGVRLGLTPEQTIWLVSSLLFSRSLSFLVFWRWEGWHYHRAWSQVSLWTGPALLAVMFFSPSIHLVLAACLAFGAVAGLGYSMSIFYSMDYGHGKGEGGGLHEALIGCGFLAGPLVGAMGLALFSSMEGGQGAVVAIGLFLAWFGAKRLGRPPLKVA